MTTTICPRPDCTAPPLPAEAQTCPHCHTPLLLNGQYRLVRPLGEGGMGKTFLAQDLRFVDTSNEWCVLKQLKETQELAPQGKQMLKQEASRLLDLRHPGIPSYRDFFELTMGTHSRFCMVQQYIKGSSLQQRLQSSGPIPLLELLPMMKDVVEILDYLHQQKQPDTMQLTPLLHLDIKPDNLMLRDVDNAVFLIDFGIAIQVDPEDIHTQGARASIHGFTRGFAPFEQTMGYAAPASDLYAWAMTCLVLLTGRTPYELLDPLEQKALWPELLALPPKLAALFHHCLALQVKDRIQDARDVLEILGQVESALSSTSDSHRKGQSPCMPSGDALFPIVETVSYEVDSPLGAAPALTSDIVASQGRVHEQPATLSPLHSLQSSSVRDVSETTTHVMQAQTQPSFVSWALLVVCSLGVLGGGFLYRSMPAGPQPIAHSLVPKHKGKTPLIENASLPAAREMPDGPLHRLVPLLRRKWVPRVLGRSGTLPASRPVLGPTALRRPATRPTGTRKSISPEMSRLLRELSQHGLRVSEESQRFFAATPQSRLIVLGTMLLRYGNQTSRERFIDLLAMQKALSEGIYSLLHAVLEAPRGVHSELRRKVMALYRKRMLGGDPRAVRGLFAACRSPHWNVRYYAIRGLFALDSKPALAFGQQIHTRYQKVLFQLLDDPNDSIRRSAVLQCITKQRRPVSMIAKLGQILRQDTDASVRNAARKVLSTASKTSSEAWRQLLLGLDTRYPHARYWTLHGVAAYSTRSLQYGLGLVAVKALTPLLQNPQCKIVRYAVAAVGQLGHHARHLLPTLQQIQREQDRRCQGAEHWERKYLKEALPLAIDRITRASAVKLRKR